MRNVKCTAEDVLGRKKKKASQNMGEWVTERGAPSFISETLLQTKHNPLNI